MKHILILTLLTAVVTTGALQAKKGIQPNSRRDAGIHVGLEMSASGTTYSFSQEYNAVDRELDETYEENHLPINVFVGLMPRNGFGFHLNLGLAPYLTGGYEVEDTQAGNSFTSMSDGSQGSFNIELVATYHYKGFFGGLGLTFNFLTDLDIDDNTTVPNTGFTNIGLALNAGYGLAFEKVTVIPSFTLVQGLSQVGEAINARKSIAINDNNASFSSNMWYWRAGIAVTYQVY